MLHYSLCALHAKIHSFKTNATINVLCFAPVAIHATRFVSSIVFRSWEIKRAQSNDVLELAIRHDDGVERKRFKVAELCGVRAALV